ELDRADARVPIALPVAVSAVDPLRRALTIGSAAERIGLRAHQRLRELVHHRPQQIRARLLQLLAQPARKFHRGLDHRAPPRSSWMDVARKARWSAITGAARPSSPSRSLHQGAASRRRSSGRGARTPRAGTLLLLLRRQRAGE